MSICHLFLLVRKTENFQSLKLLMFVSVQLRGTSAHERRQVPTVYINIMLHLLQYLTGISATTECWFPSIEQFIEQVFNNGNYNCIGVRLIAIKQPFFALRLSHGKWKEVVVYSKIQEYVLFKHLTSYCTPPSVYILKTHTHKYILVLRGKFFEVYLTGCYVFLLELSELLS